jgi:hypothetical protein
MKKRMVVMQEVSGSRAFLSAYVNRGLAWTLLVFPVVARKEISNMLWTILVILLVLWLIGVLSHVGGSLIHLLLVVAVVVLIINLVTGRRAV